MDDLSSSISLGTVLLGTVRLGTVITELSTVFLPEICLFLLLSTE